MGKIVSKKLRDSARDEVCTFQIPGVCTYNTEQTVLCHLPDESNGGSTKSDDISSGYGCEACHKAIDGDWSRITGGQFTKADKEFFMRRAQTRTLRRLIEKGIVTIQGYKA